MPAFDGDGMIKETEEHKALLRMRIAIEEEDFATADLIIKEKEFSHETVVDSATHALAFLRVGPRKHVKVSEIIEHYQIPESTVDFLAASDLASSFRFNDFSPDVRFGDLVFQGERANHIRKRAGQLALEEVLIRSKEYAAGKRRPKQIIKEADLSVKEVIDAAKEVYEKVLKDAKRAQGKDLSNMNPVGIDAIGDVQSMENAVRRVKELGGNPLRRLAAATGIPVRELRREVCSKNSASKVNS